MTDTVTETKPRGGQRGPRGPRVWKDEPTLRERVMGESLQKAILEDTGKDIDLETIRAVRFALPRWLKSDEFQTKKDNIQAELTRAKLLKKKEKAEKMLKEVAEGLSDADFDLDEDDDEDEDEDEDYDETDELEEDEDEDEDEDVFAESNVKKANF